MDLVAAAATADAATLVAREAAERLLDDERVSTLVRRVAQGLLRPPASQPELELPANADPVERAWVHQSIKHLRRALQEDPRNALGWTEQARMYTLIGQGLAAQRAMAKALALAPNHRFVLRTSARLSVHLNKPEQAHSVLMSSPRTRSDPWLMASEIAVASFTTKPSRLVRTARDLLAGGNWTPRDLTELASAVGTLELEAGAHKRARNLFRASLEDPNENSLAQAEWAASKVPGVQSHLWPAMQRTPRSFEARSRAAAANADHRHAVEHSWLWLVDQPFSTEPAGFGSYHAALVRDFRRSLEFSRRGLQANPADITLLNNAAFALAQAGKPDEADKHIRKVKDIDRLDPSEQAMILATKGLIAFRSGSPGLGQSLYGDAMERATDPVTRALALIMLASELAHIRSSGVEDVVRRAIEDGKRHLPKQDRGWLNYLHASPTDAK